MVRESLGMALMCNIDPFLSVWLKNCFNIYILLLLFFLFWVAKLWGLFTLAQIKILKSIIWQMLHHCGMNQYYCDVQRIANGSCSKFWTNKQLFECHAALCDCHISEC